MNTSCLIPLPLILASEVLFARNSPGQLPPPTLGQPVLTNGEVRFSLTGNATLRYVIEFSTDLRNWSPIATNAGCDSGRVLAFPASTQSAFYRAIALNPLPFSPAGAFWVTDGIDLKAAGTMIDSYNSADPNHSTGGNYNPATRMAGGNIYCDAGVLNISNASVFGKITNGPGGTVSIGPGGRVGDLDWAGPGIEHCWQGAVYASFTPPDVRPPFNSGFAPVYYSETNTYFLWNGNYFVNGDFSLESNDTLYVAGVVNLYVTGNFIVKSQNLTIVIPPGAHLSLYVGTSTGPSVSTTLTQVLNSGNAATFNYYGLPSNTSLEWLGQSFIGTLYAPQAVFSDGTPHGNFTRDFHGACVARSVILSGPANIHYDENLTRNGTF